MATINATNTPRLTTNGQLIIGSTGAFPVAATITAGSNVTITNGAGTITIAATGGGSGALTFIASATASNSASINFDNNLTSTYDNYLILIEGMLPATNVTTLKAQFGTGGTPTYSTSTYTGNMGGTISTGVWAGFGSGITNGCAVSQNLTATDHTAGLSNTANKVNGFIVEIHNANGSTYKTLTSMGAGTNNISSTDFNASHYCGTTWATTTVITSIKFFMDSGNISSGIFKLYGYANS